MPRVRLESDSFGDMAVCALTYRPSQGVAAA